MDDAARNPVLFEWHGAIPISAVRQQCDLKSWRVPSDLIQLWADTGGGVIFETEHILRPIADSDDQSEVEQVTQWERARGLPAGLLVFHRGVVLSTIRLFDAAYLTIERGRASSSVFSSLDDWYRSVIRAEYEERYGLKS
jgi:hypothetical protein